MITFSAQAWFRRCERYAPHPLPPRPAIVLMLGELERALLAADAVPVRLHCGTLAAGTFSGARAGEQLARIVIEGERRSFAGKLALRRPLRSWYEWQHPRWAFWSLDDRAASNGSAGETDELGFLLPGAEDARPSTPAPALPVRAYGLPLPWAAP